LAQAEAFLANLTLAEKAGIVTGEMNQLDQHDSGSQTLVQALPDLA